MPIRKQPASYQCGECGRLFPDLGPLRTHWDADHMGVPTIPDNTFVRKAGGGIKRRKPRVRRADEVAVVPALP